MFLRATIRTTALLLVAGAAINTTGLAQTDKQPITPDDYGQWERLGSARLSNDGGWLAYQITRVNEENELRVRRVSGAEFWVVPYGTRATFSNDNRWLAYSIGVSQKERDKLEKQKKPVHNKLGLRDLTTGDSLTIDEVASFAFSHDGRFLAMRRYPPSGGSNDRESKGVDLVVRDLSSGVETNFGNVSEFAWQDEGGLLALIVDAEGMAGNGVQLYDPASGLLRTLDSKAARYSGLSWREDDDDLAVLHARTDDEVYEDTTHVVLAWQGLEDRRAQKMVFDPDSATGFPADTRIVNYRSLRWSDGGETVYFGIKEREKNESEPEDSTAAETDTTETADSTEAEEPEDEEDDEEPSTVQIWHSRDVDIYPRQKVTSNRDKRENYLSAWHLSSNDFVQLGTELTENVSIAKGDRYAIGMDQTPYENIRMFGPVFNDIYQIDTRTGQASIIKERVQYSFGPSAAGKYLLYMVGDDYWTYELNNGKHTNITEGVPTSFVNLEDDHTVQQKPPFYFAGWTEDDRSVLIYDKVRYLGGAA